MFFHWYGAKAVNTSNLLFVVQAGGRVKAPGKGSTTPRSFSWSRSLSRFPPWRCDSRAHQRARVLINAVVMSLGIVSVLLILYRLVDPLVFSVETTITIEGAAQLPIYLALFAAAGIACGGCAAIGEEGISSRSQHAHGGSNSTMSV